MLLGAPGVGKGTQGALLADRLGARKIATGDILRDAVRRGSEVGLRAKRYMDAGELVPDAVILDLVRESLVEAESGGRAIFDGFPRTVPQAESLDMTLGELGRALNAVVVIDVPEETIVRRMAGRRVCSGCGQVYNLFTEPPQHSGVCDICGVGLVQRADDEETTVRRRLQVYRTATEPLVAFYSASATPVHRIDGDQPVDQVQADILTRLGF